MLRGLLLCLGLVGLLPAALAALPPKAAETAHELAALPGGRWLALDDQGLRLLDGQGQTLAERPIRAEHLDVRPLGEGVLAVVFDRQAQQPVLFSTDAQGFNLLGALPTPDFSLESLCLYRDSQQHDHLFLIGQEGLAEQWLLHGPQPRLLRKLALPPQVEHCRADDAGHRLYVSEPAVGVWAYDADGEGVPGRQWLAVRQPLGRLVGGPGALAAWPGGVAVLDAEGTTLHVYHARGTGWRAGKRFPTRSADQVLWRAGTLLVRESRVWRPVAHLPAVSASEPPVAVLRPRGQTEPVARRGDAADDPAIWLHPYDRRLSRVLATNKKEGLLIYDLAGRLRQSLPVGRLNNVDLRQGVSLGGRTVDLAVATRRDDATLALFEIDAGGEVREVGRLATDLGDIYGTCLYHPPGGGLEVFANDKDGHFIQMRIERAGPGYAGHLLRRFSVASQPEGCVVDDNEGRLFIGEEKRGIWAMPAAAGQGGAPRRMVLPVGPRLAADVEGLALYQAGGATYLIASSQGNSRFVVLDARPPYAYRGVFRIGLDALAGIDGVSETDGLEVTSAALGPGYEQGLLVVQDGYKRLPDGAQNFKYLSWQDVARALGLP
ncbi:MAG: phytase [Pseudomonadota bacterium]